MITTPEQMREAAAKIAETHQVYQADVCAARIRAIPIAPQPSYHTVSVRADTVTRVCGICDIADCETHRPAAPQPVAVTVKPLVWDNAVDVGNPTYKEPSLRRIINDYYLPFFGTDMAEKLANKYIAASALTIQPADPLSDPRVKALVEAARNCDDEWSADPDRPISIKVIRALRSALRAIGGEA